jgi:multiple antibiotic resistance protein
LSDFGDAVRLAIFVLVVIDPIAAVIGAADLSVDRTARDRTTIVLGGGAVAFLVLAVAALLADPILDALHISTPAAELAAGLVVLVPALDLLWQGPEERVRPVARAAAARLALFPFGIPLVAGPAVVAAVIAWGAAEGASVTVGGAAVACVVVAGTAWRWRNPPRGRTARVLGAFTAVAMAIIAFDLVRDGVFGS